MNLIIRFTFFFILLVVVSFVPFTMVHAASAVKGEVPILEPLQPAPVGQDPVISHNVNNVTNPDVLPSEADASVPAVQDEKGATPFHGLSNATMQSVMGNPGTSVWRWVVLAAAVLAVIGISVYSYHRSKTQ